MVDSLCGDGLEEFQPDFTKDAIKHRDENLQSGADSGAH